MSQEPRQTTEYEHPRATRCPAGCDADSVVSVQLGHSPQRFAAGAAAIPRSGLFESPVRLLGMPGAERRRR
jgi:hypothetical protein